MNTQRLKAWKISHGYHVLPIKPGMQLELHEEIGEGNNKRIWRFKGLVIQVKKPNHADGTFTIRGKTAGHMIEKIYPLSFSKFTKVILLDTYKIRRAKLYYIREKIGKDAKMKSVLSREQRNIDLLQLALDERDKLMSLYNNDDQGKLSGEEGDLVNQKKKDEHEIQRDDKSKEEINEKAQKGEEKEQGENLDTGAGNREGDETSQGDM